METVLTEILKLSPVIGILGVVAWKLYHMYLKEKQARIAIEKQFREYLMDKEKETMHIIQKDTEIKAKLLQQLSRDKKGS